MIAPISRRYIYAGLLPDAQNHALSLILLETFGADADVVSAARQIWDNPVAVSVACGGLIDPDGGVAYRDVSARNYGSGAVMYGAIQCGGVLRERSRRRGKN